MPEKQWAGNTFGTTTMHRWLVKVLRHSDPRIWYVFNDIFVVPMCMLLSPGARIAWHYFRRRWHYGWLKAAWMTFYNHVLFAQVVIDKFALYAGKRMHINIVNYDLFQRLASQKAGFVILSAHIGNYEMAGYELVSDKETVQCPCLRAGEGHRHGRTTGSFQRQQHPHDTYTVRHVASLHHGKGPCGGEIVSIPATVSSALRAR